MKWPRRYDDTSRVSGDAQGRGLAPAAGAGYRVRASLQGPLRGRGAISAVEYERAKTTVLGEQPAPSAPQQRDPRHVTSTT